MAVHDVDMLGRFAVEGAGLLRQLACFRGKARAWRFSAVSVRERVGWRGVELEFAFDSCAAQELAAQALAAEPLRAELSAAGCVSAVGAGRIVWRSLVWNTLQSRRRIAIALAHMSAAAATRPGCA